MGLQVGVRGEQAILETAYIDLNPATAPGDVRTEGRLDYFRLYPSVFLTKELAGANQLQASYTRRVNRPRGWQVNPFVDLSDALNIRQGNPNLLPEDIHAFEFSYAKNWTKATLTSSAYYRLMDDVVHSIISVVDSTSGATSSQWQNISRSETSGFEFIAKYTLNNAIDMTGNFNAFHTRFHGNKEYNVAPSEGFSWDANLTTNVKLIRNLSGQVKFEYSAPRLWAQGKGLESYVIDGGLRWDLLSRRASINFNVRDLLDQRRWGGYTLTENVRRDFESRWSRRTFTLSFNYRFGDQDMQRQDRRNRKDHFDTGGTAGGGGEVF
jgi:outer membrane receptor protein involved in Fe transport